MRGHRHPHVCFLMPTYGRCYKQPQLLNEAAWWMTQQTYPDCELIILNDCKDQTIRCDAPRITVVNSEYRCRSLGEKMNVLVELAPPGSVCAVYEDDDIILPWRAGAVAAAIRGVDFWSPGRWWYCQEGNMPVLDTNGWGYTSCAFRREAALDKHENVTEGHDARFVTWGLTNLKSNNMQGIVPPAEVAYCYRWGISELHLSGTGHAEQCYKNSNPGRPGVFDITPARGLGDYVAETRAVLERS